MLHLNYKLSKNLEKLTIPTVKAIAYSASKGVLDTSLLAPYFITPLATLEDLPPLRIINGIKGLFINSFCTALSKQIHIPEDSKSLFLTAFSTVTEISGFAMQAYVTNKPWEAGVIRGASYILLEDKLGMPMVPAYLLSEIGYSLSIPLIKDFKYKMYNTNYTNIKETIVHSGNELLQNNTLKALLTDPLKTDLAQGFEMGAITISVFTAFKFTKDVLQYENALQNINPMAKTVTEASITALQNTKPTEEVSMISIIMPYTPKATIIFGTMTHIYLNGNSTILKNNLNNFYNYCLNNVDPHNNNDLDSIVAIGKDSEFNSGDNHEF